MGFLKKIKDSYNKGKDKAKKIVSTKVNKDYIISIFDSLIKDDDSFKFFIENNGDLDKEENKILLKKLTPEFFYNHQHNDVSTKLDDNKELIKYFLDDNNSLGQYIGGKDLDENLPWTEGSNLIKALHSHEVVTKLKNILDSDEFKEYKKSKKADMKRYKEDLKNKRKACVDYKLTLVRELSDLENEIRRKEESEIRKEIVEGLGEENENYDLNDLSVEDKLEYSTEISSKINKLFKSIGDKSVSETYKKVHDLFKELSDNENIDGDVRKNAEKIWNEFKERYKGYDDYRKRDNIVSVGTANKRKKLNEKLEDKYNLSENFVDFLNENIDGQGYKRVFELASDIENRKENLLNNSTKIVRYKSKDFDSDGLEQILDEAEKNAVKIDVKRIDLEKRDGENSGALYLVDSAESMNDKKIKRKSLKNTLAVGLPSGIAAKMVDYFAENSKDVANTIGQYSSDGLSFYVNTPNTAGSAGIALLTGLAAYGLSSLYYNKASKEKDLVSDKTKQEYFKKVRLYFDGRGEE